ncbi:hypothetical protein [Thiomicrorhabdus aquaedulcis]|uniref:hypothetical protein n=1 Tax=Thiomicrorhabdus aquaedulcis TaxID=2211106 RepID=UPI000FD9DE4A|nr:hypothetical protein [Thiomicrorhabdus aquaedulcis]
MDIMQLIKEFWWLMIFSVLALIFILSAWDTIRWKAMNYWYGFPLMGKVARLSNNAQPDNHKKGWLKSERALCADYQKYIAIKSEAEFKRYTDYLNRAGDTGRHTTPALVWLLIVGLVIAEAWGFSYVLAGFTIPGASEQVQNFASIGIAFVLSVLLVWFTHLSGTELYRNSVVAEARSAWNNAGQVGTLMGKDVTLAYNEEDNDQPFYIQRLNRLTKKKVSFPFTISTIVLVVIVAIGSTYVRSTVLEKQIIEEVNGTQTSYFGVPSELATVAETANNQAQEDTNTLERKGGNTTFIILAIMFVFIQILGVIFGHKWGFGGKQSKEAYRGLGRGRYATYDDMLEHKNHVIDEAQARLESLQQKLEHKNANYGGVAIKTHKTFEDFLFEKAEDRHESQQKHEGIGAHATRHATASLASQASQTPDNTPLTAPAVQESNVTDHAAAEVNLNPSEHNSTELNHDDQIAQLKAEIEAANKQKQQALEIEALKRQLAEVKQHD